MVNLTSFKLVHTSPITVTQFLDFFESAPHLREVRLSSMAPITGAQNGRLVSLACLTKMNTRGHHPSSPLFDHVLIPVGAHVRIRVDLPIPLVNGRPPRFLNNLTNLPNFTAIKLEDGPSRMLFSGPNGEVRVVPQVDGTCLMLGSLTNFDTSKTERLEIKCGKCPFSDPIYGALLPMKDLRTLTLTRCEDPRIFVRALHHGISLSGVVVCPKLEMLVIEHDGTFDIKDIVETAAVRASRGAKLKTVRIFPFHKTVNSRLDVLELKKYVLHVESWRDQPQRSRWNEEGRGGNGGVL